MRTEKILCLFFFFILTVGLDLISTEIGLSLGIKELNPFFYLVGANLTNFSMFSLIGSVGLACTSYIGRKDFPIIMKFSAVLFAISGIIHLCCFFWNIGLLYVHGVIT